MTEKNNDSDSAALSTCRLSPWLGLVCIVFAGWSFGQNAVDLDQVNRREALQQRLVEMESALGRHDPALVEPLQSLADSATALDLYSEASTLLDRAIQIERLNSGLFSQAQIPLYFNKMASNARMGDWSEVNQSLEYLNWLLLDKNASGTETLIDNLIKLSEVHLQGVASDSVEMQAPHFRKATELVYLALSISERLWGSHDPRRLALHYSLAKQFYLQSVALERRDETAYALRAVVPGSSWVRPRRVAQSRYYRAGLRLFDDMEQILAESSETPAESLAMLDLYIADWHLLFNQEQAGASYRQAYDALRQAGNSQADLNRLFSRPQILPVPNFLNTVSLGLAALESDGANAVGEPPLGADGSGHYFRLQEWFDTMPVIPFPVTAPAIGQLSSASLTDTWLHFRLDSLNKVSRWIRGTYQSHISVVDEFTILDAAENPAVDMEYLDDRLHFLRFRPRLVDGLAQPAQGTLLYRAVGSTSRLAQE